MTDSMIEQVARKLTETLRHHGVEMHPDDIRGLAQDAIVAMRPAPPTSDEVMAFGMQGVFVPQAFRDLPAINRWIDAALAPH